MIDLSGLPLAKMSPAPMRLGGVVRGPLGGSQRINRLGDRWSFSVETPDMAWEPDGRRWAALIGQAAREGARLPIAQPGFTLRPAGSPVVATTTASGRSIPASRLTPAYPLLLGQWVGVIAGGVRYVDRVAAQVIAAADGTATIAIENLIRAPLPAASVIELERPMVEGDVTDVSELTVDRDEVVRFAFRISEIA